MPCPLPQSWCCRSWSARVSNWLNNALCSSTADSAPEQHRQNSIAPDLNCSSGRSHNWSWPRLYLGRTICAEAKVERLQQVKGVGLITAVTCVALCPELGSLSRGQTAALVGVAPYDDDSGARKGCAISPAVALKRRALYSPISATARTSLAPLSSTRHAQTPSRLVAVIRKLAILLNHRSETLLFASELTQLLQFLRFGIILD